MTPTPADVAKAKELFNENFYAIGEEERNQAIADIAAALTAARVEGKVEGMRECEQIVSNHTVKVHTSLTYRLMAEMPSANASPN